MAGAECTMHEGVCERIKAVKETIQLFNDNQAKIVENQHTMGQSITLVGESTKSAHHRLDSMEKQTEAIIRMSMSVETMSCKMQEIIDLFKEHDGRLDVLERTPPIGNITMMLEDYDDRLTKLEQTPAEKLQDRIAALEKAPAESVMKYWQLFIGAIIAGIAGMVLTILAKGWKLPG